MRQAMMFSKRGTSSAEVTAAIAASVALSEIDYWQTYDPVSNSGNGTLTANAASLVRLPRRAKPITVTNAHFFVQAANTSNVDIAIYAFNGTDYIRQSSTGSTVVAGATVIQTIALTAAFTPTLGVDYWAALVLDGTSTIARVASLHANHVGFQSRNIAKSGAGIPLPATISSAGGTANVPWVAFS